MKLYALREVWGSVSESMREPATPAPEDVTEVREQYAAIPPWLILPDETFAPGGPGIRVVLEWAAYAHCLARFTWGAKTSIVIPYVNQRIAQMAAEFTLCSKVGVVLAWALPLALCFLLPYMFNPVYSSFITKDDFLFQYVGAFKEKLWLLDLLEVQADGGRIYTICSEVGGIRQTERWRVPYRVGLLDRWEFGGSWVMKRKRLFNFKRYVWTTGWADYIGMMDRIAPHLLKLQPEYFDSYSKELPPGWKNKVPFLCSEMIE